VFGASSGTQGLVGVIKVCINEYLYSPEKNPAANKKEKENITNLNE